MHIAHDIRQLDVSPRNLRKFGLTVGGVFLALGLFLLFRHNALWAWFAWPGITLLILGLLIPRVLRSVYVVWMSAALTLGFLVAHVVLTLFFYLVVTPTGLLARLAGKDFLSLRLDRSARSYWIPRKNTISSPKAYERQF